MCHIRRRAKALEWVHINQCFLPVLRYEFQITCGENCFGRNAVCPDSERPQLCRYILREHHNSCLGCSIWDRSTCMCLTTCRRCDGDDVAKSAFLHARQKAFEGKKCCRYVAVNGGAPACFRYFFKRSRRCKAPTCVSYEDIDWAKMLFNFATHRFDILKAGYICGCDHALATILTNHFSNFCKCVVVPPMQDDFCPLPGELLRYRRTNTS